MKTVTSISGGRSSAYMALHYPTDYYVFAVVLTDHQPSTPKDPGLLRECRSRIPHFTASHEADLTLLNVLRLEQEIGQEIKWVAAEYSLDQFILGATQNPGYRAGAVMLPNSRTRFCTVEQKLKPMFWHCFNNVYDGEPMLMNIGFRWDEPDRVDGWTCDKDKFDYPSSCIIKTRRQQYRNIEWRIGNFPLYQDRITRDQVNRFWVQKGWQFPEISNCRFCFHHRPIEQQRQAELEPANLQWWLDMERVTGNRFGKHSLQDIISQALLDVFDHKPCHCTD
ncbi:hypothetical protein H6F46_11835 [Limnothrix sp. FACHB-1083]|uniref:hypothetical protein n=2 Tax=unclassified Limnothrix TaxID=2632864 RepID=UPI001680002D|nr:hypothetical protein [Limnothrix sp. FACHB-1088]MBD2161380.1 hypothetical protein [Limnothrix sp. FACHB-1083]MBD2192108.1 hypothetical protein [Limnothrix sp. FACHB-1088]